MPSSFDVERVHVRVDDSDEEVGVAAAASVAHHLRVLLRQQDKVRTVFAAAPSQDAFLGALVREPGIDWGRVEVLQLDEYVGLGQDSQSSLRRWLEANLTERVAIGHVEYMDGAAADLALECARYEAVVNARPIDLGLIGVGENGHLAFNDPHAADFDDPHAVKIVDIDDTSRAQQVRDGAFADVAFVPLRALTLTMSAILQIRTLSVVAPGSRKAPAVARALLGPVSVACPASVLRRHPDATLYVDQAAFNDAQRQSAGAT